MSQIIAPNGASPITVRASETGATLDCNLATGLSLSGGVATDNTAVLNAALENASPTAPVKLLLDGATMVDSSLVIPGGNVTIEGNGWDSGVMEVPNNTTGNFINAPILVGPSTFTTPSSNFQNVVLRDLKVDGNQPNASSVQRCNMVFNYVDGLLLDHVWSHAPKLFNALFINCNYVNIVNSRFESADTTAHNTDGVHIDGPCTNLHISGCHFRTNDDAIALNASEGYLGGNINNVTIDNCTFDNCLSLMRAYAYGGNYTNGGNNNYQVSNIVVSNCTGSVAQYFGFLCAVFLLGSNIGGIKNIDTIRDITANNISFEAPENYIAVGDPVGRASFTNCTWIAPTVVNPAVSWICSGIQISDLSLVNFRIYRTTAGNSAAYGIGAGGQTGCVIKKVSIDGFSVDDEQGQSYGQIPYLIDMSNLTINELVIDALDTTNIAALVNPVTGFTGIGTISGAGVLNTGFQIPDSVMANNCPYISATSPNAGSMCIKLAGVVTKIA